MVLAFKPFLLNVLLSLCTLLYAAIIFKSAFIPILSRFRAGLVSHCDCKCYNKNDWQD